jgi:hypothetical protein
VNATLALMRLGPDARPAVPALIKAIDNDANKSNLRAFTATVREVMVVTLGRASAGTDEAVPVLTKALETATTDKMERAAARALGEVGPPARPAVPVLRKFLKDTNPDTREAVEEALQKIGAEAEVEKPRVENRDPALPAGEPRAENAAKPEGLAQALELPEEDRKYLWDVEHHGNVLVKHGFAPFAEALQKGDTAALRRLLAEDFAGGDLRQPRRTHVANAFAEVDRIQNVGQPSAPLSRAAFVARLLELRKLFPGEPPKVKLALMQLSPRVRERLGSDWEGTAQLRLHGEHARGPPAEVVVQFRYRIASPTKEALAGPGWLRSAEVQQVLTAKAPHYLFAEVGRQRGLDASQLTDNWKCDTIRPTTGGVYVCDFDRDGFLDALLTDVGCHLYRGGPRGVFEDVTARCGLRATRFSTHATAWADLDGDGWDDLILGDRIYRNEAGVRFIDYTDRCNLRLPSGPGNLAVADCDRDGKLDLYVAYPGRPGARSWLDGKSNTEGNRLYRNRGDWQFEDVTPAAPVANGARRSRPPAGRQQRRWPDLRAERVWRRPTAGEQPRRHFYRPPPGESPADFGPWGWRQKTWTTAASICMANMYSKAGTRVIANLPPYAYQPHVMEKMRRFVAGGQLHLNRGDLKFQQVGPQMQRHPWAGRTALSRRLTTTAGSTSTPRPATSAAIATNPTAELRLAGCRSQPCNRTASVPLPGKLDDSLREFWVGNPWQIALGDTTSALRAQPCLPERQGTGLPRHQPPDRRRQRRRRPRRGRRLPQRRPDGPDRAPGRRRTLLLFENRVPRRHYLQMSLRGRTSNRQGIGAADGGCPGAALVRAIPRQQFLPRCRRWFTSGWETLTVDHLTIAGRRAR